MTDKAQSSRAWLLWAVAVFFIPFQLHYNYILNAFYHFGAPSADGGLLAQVIWHNDLLLTNPHWRGPYPFLGVHFSLLLFFLNQLSYFVPTHMAEFYGTAIAGIYAALGLAMFYLFHLCIAPRSFWQMAGLAVLAIAYSFNDIVMNGVWIVHFEYAIPLGIFLFLLQFARRRWSWAICFFLFTLCIREDAGFQLTAVLALLTGLRYWETRSLRAIKYELSFIGYAVAYSLLSWWMAAEIRNVYHVKESVFSTIFIGNPPFGHLTWPLLWERAQHIFVMHIYMWLGFLLSMGWSVHTRNPYLMVGFVAYIPWLVLYWLADFEHAGYLYAYDAYPFVLSLGWPLLGAIWRYGLPLPAAALRQGFSLQVALLLVGLVMWDTQYNQPAFGPFYGARYGSFRLQEGAINRERVLEFVANFNNGVGDLGLVTADTGIRSLIKDAYHGHYLKNIKSLPPVDSILYLYPLGKSPRPYVLKEAEMNRLANHFCIAGTTICLYTNRSLEQVQPLSPNLQPASIQR